MRAWVQAVLSACNRRCMYVCMYVNSHKQVGVCFFNHREQNAFFQIFSICSWSFFLTSV